MDNKKIIKSINDIFPGGFFSEKSIIENFFQHCKNEDVITFSDKAKEVYYCVHDKEKWKNWIDSSGKADPPPDFYSDEFGLMMDVMTVTDTEKKKGVNYQQKEQEIINGFKKKYPNLPENVVITANPAPNKVSGIYPNYKYYLKHFKRVIEEHVKKLICIRKITRIVKLSFLFLIPQLLITSLVSLLILMA